MGIIDTLFEGGLVPDAWCGKRGTGYREAQNDFINLTEGLDRKTADELTDQIAAMERESAREYFSLGFRWGVLLIIDALYGNPEDST